MKKRILFVDDEPSILQGLKRMLRSQRHEWDMAFAEGGEQALEILEQEQFDAVVSDMKMPGMDGAQLLEEVKKRYPEMVRFILSGYSDQELVMRSVGPSHQYLAKPCEPELLKAKLADTFALHELLASDAIRSLVTGMTSLPSLPNIYCAVVEELQSPHASIKAVGDLVEQDPGMAIKVLQLVNSAYFGISRQITNPAEAANFLGLDVIKSLVLSEGVFSQFDSSVIKALSLDTIKNRCLQVAQAARSITKAAGGDNKMVDQAFLAGLLHDMGTMVLASNAPEDFLRAHELAKNENIDISHAEKRVFGTTHAEVGAYLLGLWGIDDDVVSAVAYHHKPGDFPTTQFSALTAVFIASTCVTATPSSHEPPLFTEEDLAYLERLGLADKLPEWQILCKPLQEDAA